MRLLVLGGTAFVGRAIVESALRGGHDVTLFGRGRTGVDLFPAAERRTGDRDSGDYASLAGDRWDAVIDVSGYVPRHVNQALDALGDRGGRYLFISTGSVYDYAQQGPAVAPDEDTARLPPCRSTEEITADTYGPLKVGCEDDLLARLGDRATLVRPGIVAGPFDPTDRFTWWVRRAARGGAVAVPGRLSQPVQLLDAGDLADLVIALVAADRPGAFNAVGPAEPTTVADLLAACATAAGTDTEAIVVAADPALPATPLVLAESAPDTVFRRRADRARASGLPATPLVATAAAVLAWDVQRGRPPLTVGPTPEQEARLLSGRR